MDSTHSQFSATATQPEEMSAMVLRSSKASRPQVNMQPVQAENTAMNLGDGPWESDQRQPESSSESSDEDEDDNKLRSSPAVFPPPAPAPNSHSLSPLITFPTVAPGRDARKVNAQQPYTRAGEDAYNCHICERVEGNVVSMFDHYHKHHNSLLALRMHKEYTGRYIRKMVKEKRNNRRLMQQLRRLKVSTERPAAGEQKKPQWARCYVCKVFKTKKFHDLDRHFMEEHARERFEVVKAALTEN